MITDPQELKKHPAIRQYQLGKIVADMAAFNGWIRCTTSMPNRAPVIVTDGVNYAMALYIDVAKGWDMVGWLPGPEFHYNIIAWRLLPEIPKELIEKCKQ